MKNFIYKLFLFSFLAAILASCQDVIELDLAEGEKRIIINGRITDTLPVEVYVYTTAPYFSTAPNPSVSDALVYIYENGILLGQLTESLSQPGVYQAPIIGSEGNSYHVEVEIPDGATYFPNTRWASAPEVMHRIFSVDSIFSQYEPEAPFNDAGYYTYTMFTEPSGMGDNYRFKVWRNDSAYASQYDIDYFDDQFIDGKSFDNTDLSPFEFGGDSEVGDTLRIEYSSLTAEGIKFLTLLKQQTVQVGSPFDPPPAPIFGNISATSDPNTLGLGYFFASRITSAQVIITP